MARIFHMTTRKGDELANSVIAAQEAAGHETRVYVAISPKLLVASLKQIFP